MGAKTVVVGFALIAVGALVGTTTSTDSPTVFVSIWVVVLCAGSGLAFTSATAAAVARLTEERSGVGAAVVQVFQKTAGPFGTAVTGSILAAAYRSHLDVTGLPPSAASAARGGVTAGIGVAWRIGSPRLADAVRGAFVHGFDLSLVAAAGVAAAGLVMALVFLPGSRRSPAPAEPHREAGYAPSP